MLKYIGLKNGGFTIKGSPFVVNKNINDMPKFIKKLINCDKPYRIWGLTSKINDDYYVVNCVDLVTKNSFDLEICSKWIRCYCRSYKTEKRIKEILELLK